MLSKMMLVGAGALPFPFRSGWDHEFESAFLQRGVRKLSVPFDTAVDAFHAAALRAGGQDNGAPGLRPIYGADYYAAFIIDPDGYRIEAYYGPGER
jgi:hypothetical protein